MDRQNLESALGLYPDFRRLPELLRRNIDQTARGNGPNEIPRAAESAGQVQRSRALRRGTPRSPNSNTQTDGLVREFDVGSVSRPGPRQMDRRYLRGHGCV